MFLSGEDEVLVRSTGTQVQAPMDIKSITGFYLANEETWEVINALDYMDYATGYYHKIYMQKPTSVVLELGDVGNDIQIMVKNCMLLSTVLILSK